MIPHTSQAADDKGMPDFAYPQTVIKDATAALAVADRTPGSGPARLRAVLEIYAAKRAVDTDSLFAMPAFVEKQAQAKGLTNADKAMFSALEAQILNTIYSYQRYKYDQVDAPMEPLPADINLWSGKQFKARIGALYDQAMELADATPLSKYASDVDYSDVCLNYIPDVAAFVAYRKACWLKEDGSDLRPYTSFANDMAARYKAGSPEAIFWLTTAANYDSKVLTDLYKRYSSNEAARYILQQMCERQPYHYIRYSTSYGLVDEERATDTKKERNEYIDLLRESLAKFPDWYGNAALSNELKRLTRPNVTIDGRQLVAPGTDFKIGVQAEFANTVELALYQVKNIEKILPGELVRTAKPLRTETLRFNGADTTMTVIMRLPSPGYYVVIPKIDNDPVERYGSCLITEASYILPLTVNNLDRQAVIAADLNTGAPVKGAKVVLHKYSPRRFARNANVNLGNTGADGTLYFNADTTEAWTQQYLSFAYKGYTTDFSKEVVARPKNNRGDVGDKANILFFASRPIYHPGDTIEWAAAIALPDGVCAGKKVKATLLDANYQAVETTDFTTDGAGRIYGSFATAKGSLTGYWAINLEYDGRMSHNSIMVSDFRMPVFYTEIKTIERDVPVAGAVRISGRATTFSGMPVAGAEVSVNVSGAQRWRWFGPERELGTLSTTTDDAGNYTIDLPADMLAEPLDGGKAFDNFYVNIVVTAADASTAEVSQGFTTGKPYVLAASTPLGVADTSSPLKATFSAYAADGAEANIAVKWKLCTADKNKTVVRTGTATTGRSSELDLSGIAAGSYTIYVEPADKALANAVPGFTITLFNERADDVPANTGLFVPYDKTTVANGKTDILVGVSGKEAYVYTIVREGDQLKPIKVQRLSHGFHRIAAGVNNADDCSVRLISVIDGNVYDSSVSVSRPKAPACEIIAESFRDKLTPGAGESWRFRLVDGKKTPVADAAMIATLYNRALDEIQNGSWPTGFSFYSPQAYMYISKPAAGTTYSNRLMAKVDFLSTDMLQWPQYRFVEMSNYMRFRSNLMMKQSAVNRSTTTVATDEIAEAEVEEVHYDSAPAMAAGALEENAIVVREEVADEGSATTTEAAEAFNYRSGEAFQAFWQPALTADANGNIDINFTVPNANGTWQLRSFAWGGPDTYASYMAECMANKPVMVQPNLPRFLRQNDKARVLATVFNNSDEEQTITTTVEIFRLADGTITGTATSTDVIAPRGSAIAAIELTAPVDASAVGYRVRSVAGSFADGEQTFIPVLASATTVIESTEFYLNPNDKEPFTLTVKADKDASLTLQYCQNPVWTAVKAMRGIAGSQSNTATGLARKLFSALAAEQIIAGNADIANAVRNWADNPSEAALTSMLEKNENLKRLMLDQTPWVQAADNESSRMEALAQVLDPRTTESSLKSVFDALFALQNNDGGFAWTSWSSESSVWSTTEVLTTLGIANSLGMLDKHPELKKMTQSAFNYLTSQALKPNMPATNRSLTLIATLLPSLNTQRAKGIIDATKAAVKADWKTYGTTDKAWAVLMLKNDAPAVAANILESIRQHSVVRSGTGMSFPNVSDIRSYATILQAFAAMNAPRTEIDAMRQWVLIQAQASDDFGAYNPDYVVAALLMTGTNWTAVPVAQNVTVNGAPLAVSAMESATGYFSSAIEVGTGKTVVTVRPNGVTPSYGSVVAISRKPMTNVKARPARDISITKRVLVERDGQWVETNSFGLGERLRVQLTIVTKRNLDYVTIDDERPAAFEPVEQLPGYIWNGGVGFYRENLDASTRLFIGRLSKGTYHITYDMTANVAGEFISGIATLQSQYAPELTAHSGGNMINVNK